MSDGPRRLEAPWLREAPLGDLLAVLDAKGEQARVVGGAVRNTLLGEARGDVDIATTALPDEVVRRVEAAGFKAVPTGIEHGTVTVVAASTPFEVTTLREDVETFGRHATVAFGRDWKRDAERRDFTMNALSVARDGTLHDYVGGLGDIAARRVRFIGDAASRIAEDYLRILRFFRFHAAYGDGAPDPEGVAACIDGRAGLERLSRERVRMELMKLLVARHPVPALAVMTETGLLEPVLGGVPLLASFANVTKLEHALALAPDAVRRLGALAVWIVEDAQRLRERLRLANLEYERLASIADRWWGIASDLGERGGRALLYRLGSLRFADRVLIAWARSSKGATDPRWRELATLPQRWTAPVFPLKGADFLDRGVPRGPRLGSALAAAEEAWIAADFPRDRTALAAIADAAAGA
ncbi:MAG TPA: CCA tRNA nucleotidyltransferase [Xanthobacteraceae bacterium]